MQPNFQPITCEFICIGTHRTNFGTSKERTVISDGSENNKIRKYRYDEFLVNIVTLWLKINTRSHREKSVLINRN